MPQLDPAVFLPQIFWLFILFGLIYLFIAKSAAPRITHVLERRQDRIASDLEAAENLQAQAEEACQAYEAFLDKSRAQAFARVTQKREAIKMDVEAQYADLSERLNQQFATAEQRIAQSRQKALNEIETLSVDVCRSLIQSVSGLDLADKVISARLSENFARHQSAGDKTAGNKTNV